jgi:hypothetical protein
LHWAHLNKSHGGAVAAAAAADAGVALVMNIVLLQGDARRAQRAADIVREEAEALRRQAEVKGSRVAQREEQLAERETQLGVKAAAAAAAQKVRGWHCPMVGVAAAAASTTLPTATTAAAAAACSRC